MCSAKNNCGDYNNFSCMANCSGDLCYPLYRFIQDIKDFKKSVLSFKKIADVEKTENEKRTLLEGKMTVVGIFHKKREAKRLKIKTQEEIKKVEHKVDEANKNLVNHLKQQKKEMEKMLDAYKKTLKAN